MTATAQKSEWSLGRCVLGLFLLGLLVAAPLLVLGAPNLSNDAPDHARWAASFGAQFWGGELYPRWFSRANSGFGSPVMFFYPPLPSYVAALFWPFMHGHDPQGWLMAGYSCALASAFSGVFSFLWLRTLVDQKSAIFGAFIYLIAPYHLAIDLYNRGAAAEFWVMAFLPLVMLAGQNVAAGKRMAPVGLALSYGLAVFAHPTVSLCFGALPVAYALFQSEPARRVRATLVAIGSLALGAGLAGVFLVPAWFDQPKSYASAQVSGWGDYANWWLFQIRNQVTEEGTMGTGIPWYLSFKMRILVITLWTLAFVCVLWWLVWKHRMSAFARRTAAFFAIVAIVSTYLMTEQSSLLWKYISVLRFLQYPNRLGAVLAVCAAALAAVAYSQLRQPGTRLVTVFVAVCVLGWAAADLASATQAFSKFRHVPAERMARINALFTAQLEYFSFWPRTAPMKELDSPEAITQFAQSHPPQTVTPAQGVTVEHWTPRRVLLRVDLPASQSVILNHFYYAGWAAHKAGSEENVPLRASTPDGLMQIDAPAGNYELVVELPADGAEKAGRILSGLSLLGVAAMLIVAKRR